MIFLLAAIIVIDIAYALWLTCIDPLMIDIRSA